MVLAGSDGETKREMLSALQLNGTLGQEALHNTIGAAVRACFQSTGGVTVSLGNRIFAQQHANIDPQYKAIIQKHYDGDVDNVCAFATYLIQLTTFLVIGRFCQQRSCTQTN